MADDTRGATPPASGSSAVPPDAAAGRHGTAAPVGTVPADVAPQAPGNLSTAPAAGGNAPTAGYGAVGAGDHPQAPGNQPTHHAADRVTGAAADRGAGYDPDRQATVAAPVVDEHRREHTQPSPAAPVAAPVGHDRAADHDVTDRPVDRDGDGRDDRTGAVMPATAKEMAAAQRARYGGLHMGSAFFGWMSAVGIAVILLAVLSAAGLAFGLYSTLGTAQQAADQATTGIGLGAAIALLVVLFIAYLAGGYVAGRMARFNGTKQGLGVWLWGVIVTVLAALAGLVLGTQYNVFDQLNLPALPVESGTATTAGFIALGAVLVVTLLGAMLGGKLGSRYHRKVDRAAFEPVEV